MPDKIVEENHRQVVTPAQGRDYAFRVYPIDDATDIRFGDAWRIVAGSKWLIVSFTLIAAVVAAAVSFAMTPMYRSEVLVAPVKDQAEGRGLAGLAGQMGGLAALAGINVNAATNTAESLATLRSRAFTQQFITEHRLMPILFAELWNDAAQTWLVPAGDEPTMWEAYELFDSIRRVDEDAETGLVSVAVAWPDPNIAAEWADALIRYANESLRKRAIEESRRNLDFLQKELERSTTIEIRTALYGLVEAEMKNAMFASGKAEYAFRVIDPAVVPEKRYSPNRLLIVLLGACAGLVLSVLFAVIRGSNASSVAVK